MIPPQSSLIPLPADDEDSSTSGSVRSIPPELRNQVSSDSDRAERQYRHYLTHDFDDRLTLPLWFPSVIDLGSVGFVRHGQFVKILDALRPPTDLGELPPMAYLDEFASLQTIKMPVNVRNAAERGLDLVNAITSFIRTGGEKSKCIITQSSQY